MQTRESNKAVEVASLVVFAAALLLVLPLIERLIAAAWQWYKFSGYSNDGHISLSLNTGLFFSGLLAVTFGFALWCNRVAKDRPAPQALALSFWAMCVVAATATVYWVLGMSSLNVWRA